MLKFLSRLLINITKFLLLSLPLQLIGSLLLLIYLPFHFAKPRLSPKLPFLLRWFDCADLYQEFGRTPVTYLSLVYPMGWWKTYTWLAWRNPINYFGYKYLGFFLKNPYIISKYKYYPTYQVGTDLREVGNSSSDVPGFFYIELKCDSKTYYEYYWIYRYGQSKKCFRFRLGWKIGQDPVYKEEFCQEVFVISPLMSYSGK